MPEIHDLLSFFPFISLLPVCCPSAGSQTYGKGLIQSVYELSDGSGMVVTVGKYLTPRWG